MNKTAQYKWFGAVQTSLANPFLSLPSSKYKPTPAQHAMFQYSLHNYACKKQNYKQTHRADQSFLPFSTAEQKLPNFTLSPQVLREGLLVNFGAGQKAEVRGVAQEMEGEHPQSFSDLLHCQSLQFALEEDSLELTGGEVDQSAQVPPVNVFLVELSHPAHQFVVLLHQTVISLEAALDHGQRTVTTQIRKSLINNIRLCIFLLVGHSRAHFGLLHCKLLRIILFAVPLFQIFHRAT